MHVLRNGSNPKESMKSPIIIWELARSRWPKAEKTNEVYAMVRLDPKYNRQSTTFTYRKKATPAGARKFPPRGATTPPGKAWIGTRELIVSPGAGTHSCTTLARTVPLLPWKSERAAACTAFAGRHHHHVPGDAISACLSTTTSGDAGYGGVWAGRPTSDHVFSER
jgi:hypothetical protein